MTLLDRRWMVKGMIAGAAVVIAIGGIGLAAQSGRAASTPERSASLHDRLTVFKGSDAALSSMVAQDLHQHAPGSAIEVATYLKRNGFADNGCPQSADRDCLSNILHYGTDKTTVIRVISRKEASPAQFAVTAKTQAQQN